LYSEANVIQEVGGDGRVSSPCFSYEGTGRQARTSVVEVSWVNPSEFYKENKEVVEDADAIQRYGYNHKTVRAMGCTDREQARRLGRYVLGSNVLNTETVSFTVATEGAMLLPGDILVIADPLKTEINSGGRIVSATTTQLTVDKDLGTPDMTKDWYVYTYGSTGIAQRSEVSNISSQTITVQNSFTNTPSSVQMFVLVDEDDENTFRRYRVQSYM
jgi:predicted phage tail protein